MLPITQAILLTGLLQLDGQPLSQQRVLLISGDMKELLASTTSGDDGVFKVTIPDGKVHKEVVLLVKVQGPVIALGYRNVKLGKERVESKKVEFNFHEGDFSTIRSEIRTTSGWPPYLNVYVNPVHLEGIPEPLEKFFNEIDEETVESSFYEARVDGREFELKVMRGTYRVGADYINYSRPMIVNPEFENYVVSSIEVDREEAPLEGQPLSGYLIDLNKDRDVVMTIEPIADEDLSPLGP